MSYDDADDYAGLPASMPDAGEIKNAVEDMLARATVLRAGPTYTVLSTDAGPAIRCHRCTQVSFSQEDVAHLFCGRCEWFHHAV